MTENTSIGPARPSAGVSPEMTDDSVDAIEANEFDVRHDLVGAEAKPFRRAGERKVAPKTPHRKRRGSKAGTGNRSPG